MATQQANDNGALVGYEAELWPDGRHATGQHGRGRVQARSLGASFSLSTSPTHSARSKQSWTLTAI